MKTLPFDYPADREWTVGEIPQRSPESLSEIAVHVSYNGDSNALTAEVLDHYVIPLFKIAPRLLEVIAQQMPDWLNRFTPEENELLMKLADTPSYVVRNRNFESEIVWGPSRNLSAVMAFRAPDMKDYILEKVTTYGSQVIARNSGVRWIPEEDAELIPHL
jgi:hypothetical protein